MFLYATPDQLSRSFSRRSGYERRGHAWRRGDARRPCGVWPRRGRERRRQLRRARGRLTLPLHTRARPLVVWGATERPLEPAQTSISDASQSRLGTVNASDRAGERRSDSQVVHRVALFPCSVHPESAWSRGCVKLRAAQSQARRVDHPEQSGRNPLTGNPEPAYRAHAQLPSFPSANSRLAMQALVGGADCGPSNPLAQLSKQYGTDRGAQQVSRVSATVSCRRKLIFFQPDRITSPLKQGHQVPCVL